MNTFSLVLFGWLLYLAISGKLTEFVQLATGPTGAQKQVNSELSAGGITAQNIGSELSGATVTK